jgi:phospholipase/carboxylesterase
MPPVTELVQSEAGLTYRLRRGQPHGGLIVMLHGLSGDENVMWIFDHALPRPATVIAPRALYASELGGYSWARAVMSDELDHVDFREAIDHLAHFLREVIALQQDDPERVILMGFSQGAALSYVFSQAHPEVLRGVIALAGFLPRYDRQSSTLLGSPRAMSQLSAGRRAGQNTPLRYLIIHGTRDEAVPIERAREARAVLEQRGASVEYHEHRIGHKVSAQGMQEIARWVAETLREF